MRIEPGNRSCTAFISPFGMFQYIRMPFGLVFTGSVYSRMLDIAIKEVDRDFWMLHLDDILTYSVEPWAHFGHLTQVVLAHSWNQDTKLFRSKVEYLGHKISKGGVSMIPE